MVLRTYEDCSQFIRENEQGDLILHLVPADDGVHPASTTLSLLFIKNIETQERYVFPFDHPDAKSEVRARFFLVHAINRRKNRKWVLDKKSFLQMVWLPGLLDANLVGFLKKNDIIDASDSETLAHNMVRRFTKNHPKVNKVIPLMKHLEAFDDLATSIEKMVKNAKVDPSFQYLNDHIIETLAHVERNGIYVDREIFTKHFDVQPDANGFVRSQYNIYTSTGRPSNRFGGVNYAALNHDDGCRSAFTSRYGSDGRMVVIDYSAFHPRIICMLTGYHVPSDTDIYAYLAGLYFHKSEVDDVDISEAKKLTFRQLYGGVEPKYQHIKYLASLKSFIDNQWEFFQKNNYVETPLFKRKITDKHITEPNPTKLFNYILQAVEGEISICCLERVLKYLRGKKTRAVLYTYDAVLYDFHREDGLETLKEVQNLMSMGGKFPMKTYVGNSYQDVALVPSVN